MNTSACMSEHICGSQRTLALVLAFQLGSRVSCYSPLHTLGLLAFQFPGDLCSLRLEELPCGYGTCGHQDYKIKCQGTLWDKVEAGGAVISSRDSRSPKAPAGGDGDDGFWCTALRLGG